MILRQPLLRTSNNATPTLLSVTTALDPRFHDFSYIHDISEWQAKLQVVRDATMEKVVEIAAEISEPDTSANGRPPESSSDEPATEPPAKRTRGESNLISFLTEDSGQPDSDNQQERPPTKQQITAYYMQLPTAANDPLSSWKSVSAVCQSLAALVCRLFSMTGSSVPCEHLFSTAGLIVNDLRGRQSPKTVAMLLFLNKNNDL